MDSRQKNRMLWRLLFILAISLLIISCGVKVSKRAGTLVGPRWYLHEIRTADSVLWPATDGRRMVPTLMFGNPSADLVSGSTGCNLYEGNYSVAADSIRIRIEAIGMANCGASMQTERTFLYFLDSAAAFHLSGDTLTMTRHDGMWAKFSR